MRTPQPGPVLTDDHNETVSASMDGLIDGVMGMWSDDSDMRPSDRLLSAFAYLSDRLFGLVGLRLVAIEGEENSGHVAINMITVDAHRIGQAIAHLPPTLAIPALLIAAKEMAESSNHPDPETEA